MRRSRYDSQRGLAIAMIAEAGLLGGAKAQAADSPNPSSGESGKMPNILVTWGGDIGVQTL